MIGMEAGISFLAEAGLNLLAVLDCNGLPGKTRELMLAAGIPLAEYRRLVLLGHGGRKMWAALQDHGMKAADPVDHYSTVVTQQFIREYLDSPPTLWLYPDTSYLVPLQQLGQLAGWSHRSPLGQGIHPEYGVWFAYRSAFLTTQDLPLRSDPPRSSPCDTCAEKPCIATCPAAAVALNHFDVEGCAGHRLRPESSCADRCLSRLACPVAPEHRYTLPQIQYHYRHSLTTLRSWYGA